jgi:two-component system, OmpR family, response regulator
MSAERVLILEDDSDLRRILQRGLEEEGMDVEAVGRGADALMAAVDNPPAAMVVDIGLPDSDGRDVCQALRAQGIDAPVIFLTARATVTDRLSGFSAGGDDYLTKPFELAELIARLRALLRRSVAETAIVAHDLRLDPATHALLCGEASVPLTPTEFRLLGTLAARPGQALRRRELVAAAWPDGAIVHDNTLDVYVARLRRKLRGLDSNTSISTVHGVGYRLG